MPAILMIDDEPSVGWAYAQVARAMGHRTHLATSAEEGLRTLAAEAFDLVLLDLQLPGMTGLDALDRIRRDHPGLPVVVLTAQTAPEVTVEATRRGAREYLVKGDFDLNDLKRVIRQGLEARADATGATAVRSAPGSPPAAADNPGGVVPGTPMPVGLPLVTVPLDGAMVGRCPAMREVYKRIGLAATCDLTVLIEGETGTGKELVGHAIHRHSRRGSGPYVVVNCACLPGELLESELFGHVKGSFTGAIADKPGQVELADGGTLFLDELGELPPALQAALLRFTETRQAARVGGRKTYRVDVRIVAATNKRLRAEVEAGRFRRDLYYRLNALSITLPALRDRGGDLDMLVDHFLERAKRQTATVAGGPVGGLGISAEARARLAGHHWPGNVRELRHAIEQAVVMARGGAIRVEHLPDFGETIPHEGGASLNPSLAVATAPTAQAAFAEDSGGHLSDESVARVVSAWIDAKLARLADQPQALRHEALMAVLERPLLTTALAHFGGHQARLAAALDLHRTTLREKLRRHGLLDASSAGASPGDPPTRDG